MRDGVAHGRDDGPLNSADEGFIEAISVNHHGAGGVVGVGAIDEHVRCGDGEVAFDFGEDGIQVFPTNHQDIERHDGEAGGTLLEDDSNGAELAFLSVGAAGFDAASDDHGIIRLEIRGGGAYLKGL